MVQCPSCQRTYLDELIQEMCVNGDYVTKCMLCALSLTNKIHELPKSTPFRGPLACKMFKEAVAHLKSTSQPVPEWAEKVIARMEKK